MTLKMLTINIRHRDCIQPMNLKKIRKSEPCRSDSVLTSNSSVLGCGSSVRTKGKFDTRT